MMKAHKLEKCFPCKKISVIYDLAHACLTVRWGNVYSEPDEADFFGDGAEKGDVIGFIAYGITHYHGSSGDHVNIGTAIELMVRGACVGELDVSFVYAPPTGDSQSITIKCSGLIVNICGGEKLSIMLE